MEALQGLHGEHLTHSRCYTTSRDTAAKEVIELKDGSTVYIFKDGKMAMEDKYGRATRMKKETVMETKDGRKIIMHGDEVMRLDSLLRHGDGS